MISDSDSVVSASHLIVDGPGPARTVKTNAGSKLHDEVQITRTLH